MSIFENIEIPIEDIKVKEYIKLLSLKGASCYIVGGYVRDYLLDRDSKDIDIEVYHIDFKVLQEVFLDQGVVQSNFGVIALKNTSAEFAIPRSENKIGIKHVDFEINLKPNMDLKEAAIRRDFTINSIMYDVKNKKIIDNYNGIKHLKQKVICHISDKFLEDALRVLRAIRFSFELGFTINDKTILKCLDILGELKEVSAARKNQEISKFFNVSQNNFKIGIDYFEIILLPYFNLEYLTELPFLKTNMQIVSMWNFKKDTMILLNSKQGKYEKSELKVLMLSSFLSDINIKEETSVLDIHKIKSILGDILINKKEKKIILNLVEDISKIDNILELASENILLLFNKYKENIKLLIELMLVRHIVSLSYKTKTTNSCYNQLVNTAIDMDNDYNKIKAKYDYLNELYSKVKKFKQKYNGQYFIKKGYSGIDIKHKQEEKILEYINLNLK